MTSVKISLENEVRRVLLRGEDGTTLTFHKLINTLYNLFPSLAGKVFSLTWQDDEGDTVTCSSDAELEEAILVMQGKGKVLRFTVQTQGGEAPVKPKLVHGSVTCDECGVKPIVGIRYKCAIRHDYDLCEACEGKRIQPYPMIKIVEPSQAPQILIYGLPDGTRNDEGGNAWPRGWRHGHGGPHHPHHRGPGFFAPNFAAPPAPFAPAPAPAPAPTFEGGHHPRRGRGCWARRWVPAEAAVPTAEVKVENPVTSEKTDEQSQLEEELIEKAILESLEINDNAKPVKVEGSSTASVVVEPAVVVNTTTPVVPPAAVAAAPAPLPVPSVKLSMRGVKDVTFPDGTIVQPGTIFRKVWRIRNDGSQAWPEGVALVSVGGDLMGNPNARESIPSVAPNEEATVAVSLTAPTSPGMYTAYYRLQTKDQQFFGNRLWATVVVSDQDPDWHVVAQKPESPTPTPQPAPIAPTSAVTFVTPDVANVAAPVKSEDSVPAPPATPVNTIPAPVAVPNPTAPVVAPPSAPEPAAVAPNRAASLLWRRELELLREMGFTDNELVIPLLQTHLGSPLSLSGDKNARPNAEGMQQVVAALLNLMN